MARIRPAWYYEQQAAEANRRETYFRNRTPTPPTGTVNSRGPQTTVYYRSLLLREGTESIVFVTNVDNEALALVSAANAGLLTTAPTGSSPRPLRRSGVKPSRISWYRGDATPTRQTTAWQTSYIRYSTAGDRSHYSVPFSQASGVFDAGDLVDRFNQLFGAGGTGRTALGTANGRASLTLERTSFSQLT